MNILNDQGLVIQGAGPSSLNYAVAQISKSITFTYSSGVVNVLTITASNTAPTDLVVCYYYTWTADNTNSTGGPQSNWGFQSYKLLSTGYWSLNNDVGIYGQGQAWQSINVDYGTQRIIKLQSQGNNATYPNLSCTYQLMVACSNISYLNFS